MTIYILIFWFLLAIAMIIIFSYIQKKHLNGIVTDTLKNPMTGRWSRKNLTGFMSFGFAMFYSTYGMILNKQVQEFVVMSFLTVTATCLGISSWEKKTKNNGTKYFNIYKFRK